MAKTILLNWALISPCPEQVPPSKHCSFLGIAAVQKQTPITVAVLVQQPPALWFSVAVSEHTHIPP